MLNLCPGLIILDQQPHSSTAPFKRLYPLCLDYLRCDLCALSWSHIYVLYLYCAVICVSARSIDFIQPAISRIRAQRTQVGFNAIPISVYMCLARTVPSSYCTWSHMFLAEFIAVIDQISVSSSRLIYQRLTPTMNRVWISTLKPTSRLEFAFEI